MVPAEHSHGDAALLIVRPAELNGTLELVAKMGVRPILTCIDVSDGNIGRPCKQSSHIAVRK